MKTSVLVEGSRVGELSHDASTQRWAFAYHETWIADDNGFPLSPRLSFQRDIAENAEQHGNAVRIFFENLLPEGQALDDAVSAHKLSKANTFGLLVALGRETSGALEIANDDAPQAAAVGRRQPVSRHDLSERIRARPHLPFSVWDGRVRLSIAGYQDKLAVLEEAGAWYLVEGRRTASTHLLKPEPINPALSGMTTNERFCMALAAAVRVNAAPSRLENVPEPVLVIERFDRVRVPDGVSRIHVVDGCQALGLPVALKYERPYGSGQHVKHIRDGANLPAFFRLIDEHAASPVRERIALLRWVIFQTLIGNVDAHAKNLSFFFGADGLRLAPAYDLVCGLIYGPEGVEDTLAMAIGDEFAPRSLAPYDWATFAINCALPGKLVAQQLQQLTYSTVAELAAVAGRVQSEGGDAATIERVSAVVRRQAESLAKVVPDVARITRKEARSARPARAK